MIIGDMLNTRKCPFCAEYIKAEATKCRYCRSELPPADAATGTKQELHSRVAATSLAPSGAIVAPILKMWRGELPLWQSFWLFAVLPLFGIHALSRSAKLYEVVHGEQLWIRLFYLSAAAFLVFVLIATWRSAGKYSGPYLWSLAARSWVCLQGVGLAVLAYAFVGFLLGNPVASEVYLDLYTMQLNTLLPRQADELTVLERTTASLVAGRPTLTFHYRFLPQARTRGMTEVALRSLMYRGSLQYNCRDPASRDMLNRGVTLRFVFRDDWHYIGHFWHQLSDCRSAHGASKGGGQDGSGLTQAPSGVSEFDRSTAKRDEAVDTAAAAGKAAEEAAAAAGKAAEEAAASTRK